MTEHEHDENSSAGSAPDGGPRRLRIGDAEREQAARRLGEHFAAGRLDEQEQLDALFADLPGEAGEAPHRDGDKQPGTWRCGPPTWAGRGHGRRGGPPRWLPIVLVAAAIAGAGCAISHGKPPIMLLPLLVLAGVLFARSRRFERADAAGDRR